VMLPRARGCAEMPPPLLFSPLSQRSCGLDGAAFALCHSMTGHTINHNNNQSDSKNLSTSRQPAANPAVRAGDLAVL